MKEQELRLKKEMEERLAQIEKSYKKEQQAMEIEHESQKSEIFMSWTQDRM